MSPDPVAGFRLLAPAKINLALEVLRRRGDGYHEIDTVMTTLDLADDVTVHRWTGLEVRYGGPEARGLDPAAANDLPSRAARALAGAASREPDALIEVTKRIPHPAGLGGGASDAGAVLRGLNELWDLGWPAERLAEVGATVGSDVPFFVHGGVARCTGRGEIVQPLRDLRPLRLLVLVPPIPGGDGKTARRFAALVPRDFSDGDRSQRLAHRLARGAPPPTADLVNAFETVVERTDAELLAHYGRYHAIGAPKLHLCGAGPAVYMFVTDRAKVSELKRDFAQAGADVLDAQTLPRAAALRIEALDGGAGTP